MTKSEWRMTNISATKDHKDRKEILFFVLYVFFRGYIRFPAVPSVALAKDGFRGS